MKETDKGFYSKNELTRMVAEKSGFFIKDVNKMYESLLEVMIELLLEGKEIKFNNLGKLEVRVHKDRVGRNPKKPEETCIISGNKVIKFSAFEAFKNKLNNK